MQTKIPQLVRKLMGVVPALALMLAVQSVSSTCFYCLHQPDVPAELQQI